MRSASAQLPTHSAWLKAATPLGQSLLGGCAAKWLAVAVGQYVYFRNHGQAFIFPETARKRSAFNYFLRQTGFSRRIFSFNAPVWSVSVETLTYAAFFLVVRQFGFNPIIALGVGLLKLDPFSSSRRMGFPNLCLEWGLFFFSVALRSSST